MAPAGAPGLLLQGADFDCAELAAGDDRLPGCTRKEDRSLGEVAAGVPPRARDLAGSVVVDDDRGGEQRGTCGDDEALGLLGDRDLAAPHRDGAVQCEGHGLAVGVALGVARQAAHADLGPALPSRVAVHLGLGVQDDLPRLGGNGGGLRRLGSGGRSGRRGRRLGSCRAGHAARGADLCRSAGVGRRRVVGAATHEDRSQAKDGCHAGRPGHSSVDSHESNYIILKR